MLIEILLFAVSELATVESIATLGLFIVMGGAWAYRGYRQNRAARDEPWSSRKALSTFAAGGIVGLALVLSGHGFDSGHVMALSGFLVPLIDDLWTTATKATTTATDMAKDGASIPEIALEVAEVVDREVDIEDAMAIVAEYERRFGTLDPDPEHVEERAKELRDEYDEGGPGQVYDRFGPEEAVEDDEADSERASVTAESVAHPYIDAVPVDSPRPSLSPAPVPAPDTDGDADAGGDDTDGDDTDDEPIHESA